MITNLLKFKSSPSQETRTYTIEQSTQVKSFLANKQEGIFGFEYYQDNQSRKFNFFSHTMSPVNEPPTRPILLDPLRQNQSCFYLHFQHQSFLPFTFKHVEDFWMLLEKNIQNQIKQGAKVFLQVMYQYNPNNQWKVEAYDKYNDYLNGIKNPSSNKYLLKMQYKLLDIFRPPHKPFEIDEVINKLEQDGYRIAIRLIVEGEEKLRFKVADKIQLVLNNSRYANAWSWTQVINKRKFVEDTQSRVFPNRYKEQILCPSELQFFFGGGEIKKEELRLQPIDELIQEAKPETKNNKEVVLDYETEEIVEDLIATMRKLNLTKGENLKVLDYKESLALKIISFECPPDLTMEKLRKRIEDFTIHMHVDGISFDKGTVKGSIAFMYPRKDRQTITLKDIMETNEFRLLRQKHELPIIIGLDVYGNFLSYDLVKLVHILVAGATNQGKSVYMNVLLLSLTMLMSPDELKLYIIDPKLVEFVDYKNFPHLMKLVTDVTKAAPLLDKLIDEMETRYEKLMEAGVKTIQQYNRKFPNDKWAYQVVVIDEYSDLLCVDDSVEQFVLRLGQKARAAGIHVIIATQKPSKDVVTPVIKSNMVTRIGFTCKQHNDYVTIFGRTIPFRLLGMGDGVIDAPGNSVQFVRFQSPINEDEGIFDKIVEKWGGKVTDDISSDIENDYENRNDKYESLKRIVCETGETRNRHLYEELDHKLTPNEISNYLQNLVEEGILERVGKRFRLMISEEKRQEIISGYEANQEY